MAGSWFRIRMDLNRPGTRMCRTGHKAGNDCDASWAGLQGDQSHRWRL